MKSIQQQLQSRISMRRNAIRWHEEEVVAIRHIISLIGTMGLSQLKDKLRLLRSDLKLMAADQKLDKVLYSRLIYDARWEREFEALTRNGIVVA